MLIAKVNDFRNITQLLTYYKLKVFVHNRGSYGAFKKSEIPQVSSVLKISIQTLKNHIKFLINKGLLSPDLTNSNNIRVRATFHTGKHIAGVMKNSELLQLTVKKFKAFLMELATEDLLSMQNWLKKKRDRNRFGPTRKGKSKANGTNKGSQLADHSPISCSFQGLLLGKHKSTVSRWRKQNNELYHNRIQKLDQTPDILKYLEKLPGKELINRGKIILARSGSVLYQYISLRKGSRLKVKVKRKHLALLPLTYGCRF